MALPIEIQGTDSTDISDYCYCLEGEKIPLIGGAWHTWNGAGLWSWHLMGDSLISWNNIGARLLRTN